MNPQEVDLSKPRSGVEAGSGQNVTGVLMELESQIRRQQSEKELVFHMLNETRRLLRFRQAFCLVAKGKAGQLQVIGVSSLAAIDRNAPMIRWVERLVGALPPGRRDGDQPFSLDQAARSLAGDPDAVGYPFTDVLWVPMRRGDGSLLGGLLMFSAEPWDQGRCRVANRLGETYGHAWSALRPRKNDWTDVLQDRRLRWSLLGAFLIACVFPVSMSALAPMEVVAHDPAVIAAPLAGVVADILIPQNTLVKAGQAILRFEDTKLRNDLELAQRRMQVASARFAGTSQAAIDSADANREVAINKAELDLATAQYAYARDLREKATLRAPMDGIAIYSDRRDWQGRPVETGQQIMRIADPAKTEFSVLLPVQDSLLIKQGARVRIYLDSSPLRPLDARLTRASYQAEKLESGAMAYRLAAQPTGAEAPDVELRIGTRGTAQVYGGKVPLVFYLLRRPITAARQALGW